MQLQHAILQCSTNVFCLELQATATWNWGRQD